MARWTVQKFEEIRNRLEEIQQRNGVLTPAAVVRDARRPTSPLHDHFNWNLQDAAHEHWLSQARRLITTVHVVHNTTGGEVKGVYYIRDPAAAAQEPGYIPMATILSDGFMARQRIVNDLERIVRALERTRLVAVAIGGADEIDTLIDAAQAAREEFLHKIPARRRRAANS